MIDKLKSTLEKIREARAQELQKGICSYVNEEVCQQKRAELVLELPFSTDQQHILEARSKEYQALNRISLKKRKQTAYKIIQQWIHSGLPEEIKTRNSFCSFLQYYHVLSYHRDLGYKAEVIKSEELSKLLSLENMQHCINAYPPDDNLKHKYLNYAENLIAFINQDLYVQAPIPKKQPLSLIEAGKFFEYLEERALKSTTIRAYTDIILCRTLLYASLPAKKIFELGPPKSKTSRWCLQSDDITFPVPRSFVALWRALSFKDRLLPKACNEDQLSKKISRLGKYAGLQTALNPSILRNSLPSLQSALGLEGPTTKTLPPR